MFSKSNLRLDIRILIASVLLLFIAFSCSDGKTDDELETFFLNRSSDSPYTIHLWNPDKPFMDQYYRYNPVNSDGNFVLQEYNSALNLTSEYLLKKDGNFISALSHHVIAQKLKIEAKIKSNQFYPLNRDENVHFKSQFPTNADTVDLVYSIKREVVKQDTTIQTGENQWTCIPVEESIKLVFIDLKNQKEQSKKFSRTTYYAKDLGPVYVTSPETSSTLILKKVLSEEEWQNLQKLK